MANLLSNVVDGAGDNQFVFEIPSVKFVPKRCVRNKDQLASADPVSFFENNVEPQSGEKKQRILTVWLNKIMTPPVEVGEMEDGAQRSVLLHPNDVISTMKKAASGDGPQCLAVPTKEEASLQVYVSRRWMNRLRLQSSTLYMTLEPLLARLDDAIDNQKISVRKDKTLYNDVGLQRYLLGIFASVYPLWLRIGLEAVYGTEIDQIKSNNDNYGVNLFIAQRMFNDPDLQNRFGFSSVVHYYKKEYATEIAKFFLKKFLRLFIFFDHAKKARLIKHDPCLFHRNSKYKSIKDVFSALTSEALSGDGNLFKTLTQVGYQPGYVQSYVDEVHYVVKELFNDLRDGVILCRVVELLTDDFTLMQKLRCPPISLHQKTHNVGVSLSVLGKNSIQVNDIDPKKIVAGHNEKTMTLISRMMVKFANIKLRDGVAQLAEIFIRFQACCKGFLLRRNMISEKEHQVCEKYCVSNSTDRPLSSSPSTMEATSDLEGVSEDQDEQITTDLTSAALKIQQWWRGITMKRKLQQHLKARTAVRIQSWWRGITVRRDMAQYRKAIAEEKLKNRAATIIQAAYRDYRFRRNSNNFPAIVIVAYKCDILRKWKAACAIQHWWREMREEREQKQRQLMIAQQAVKDQAAKVIQAAYRAYRFRRDPNNFPAIVIAVYQRTHAAIRIQKWWRGVTLRRRVEQQLKYQTFGTYSVPNGIDGSVASSPSTVDPISDLEARLENQNEKAARAIQRWWREMRVEREVKQRQQEIAQQIVQDQAAKVIQAAYRDYRFRRNPNNFPAIVVAAYKYNVLRNWKAACAIQHWWREMREEREQKQRQLMIAQQAVKDQAAKVIQAAYRAYRFRLDPNNFPSIVIALYQRTHAAVRIQSWWRGVTVRRDPEQHLKAMAEERLTNRAATRIQAAWRGYRFRCNPNNFPSVVEAVTAVRRRIADATKAATEEQTVNARTTNGLDYLLNYESLTVIRKGLQELEVVTRLSATSCVRLVENGAVRVLFLLIHEMNLGVASQTISFLALSILLNLAKYDRTRSAITGVQQWPLKLVGLLQKFHDTGGEEVFSKVALLIIVVIQDEAAALEINNSKLVMQKVRTIRATYLRREERRREEERRKLLQEHGKAAVVLNARRIPKRSYFWEGKIIRFTPNWILANDKPNEQLSKEEAMAWLSQCLKLL